MQRGKFRFCIDRAKFCRVGDIDHARQNHMLVLSVAVAAHDLAHKRRRQLTVGRLNGADLVAGGFDRTRLMDVDVAGHRRRSRPPTGAAQRQMTIVLASVPPTMKCTSASGQDKRARTVSAASSTERGPCCSRRSCSRLFCSKCGENVTGARPRNNRCGKKSSKSPSLFQILF